VSTPSADLARTVLGALLDHGVSEVVVAPGSRNAPLSFASYDAAAAGLVRLHTRLDERSAGFLALGLAKVSGRPVAVLCTSGTAVANLHPAVLEAVHAGVPLVVVTADRPARLRGTGANQTTDQVGVFLPLVPTHDLSASDSRVELATVGPTHLNVRLDDPLVPSDRWDVSERSGPPPSARSAHRGGGEDVPTVPLGPRSVVVAGDYAGRPVRVLAERAG